MCRHQHHRMVSLLFWNATGTWNENKTATAAFTHTFGFQDLESAGTRLCASVPLSWPSSRRWQMQSPSRARSSTFRYPFPACLAMNQLSACVQKPLSKFLKLFFSPGIISHPICVPDDKLQHQIFSLSCTSGRPQRRRRQQGGAKGYGICQWKGKARGGVDARLSQVSAGNNRRVRTSETRHFFSNGTIHVNMF